MSRYIDGHSDIHNIEIALHTREKKLQSANALLTHAHWFRQCSVDVPRNELRCGTKAYQNTLLFEAAA